MHAELFIVQKVAHNYGNRSYKIHSKIWDEHISNLSKSEQKAQVTKSELAKSVPSDHDKALAEYVKFKDMLFARHEHINFVQSTEEGFNDRMMLLLYNITLGDIVYDDYEFVLAFSPTDWMDSSFAVISSLESNVLNNYIQPSYSRPRKLISTTDYCTQLAHSLINDPGWQRGTAKNAHQLVFRCYDIFPYNDDAAKRIYDLNLMMMEFFVFSNYTTRGVGSGVIYREMKEQMLHFDSSLHFHDYFYRVLSRLNDAHISYKVDCYQQFTFVQPIYIQFHTSAHYITKVNLQELERWVGAEIISIDNGDTYYKIFNYGSELGKSHNSLSRYALGLSRLFFESNSRDFLLDRGLYLNRNMIPNVSYLAYKLRLPGDERIYEIKVDWMVFKNPTLVIFEDQYTYWSRNCEAKPLKRTDKTSTTTTTTTLQKRDAGVLTSYNNGFKNRSRVKKRSDTTNYKPTFDGMIPIVVGPGFAFFILNDPTLGDYGVLVIQTFNVPDMDIWFRNMKTGFMALMDKRITRLLLDLTGNSGGILCLAYSLLGVLSPSSKYPFPATEFSYGTRAMITNSLKRVSTCVDEAKMKSSPFKLDSFSDLETRVDFPDGSSWESTNGFESNLYKGLTYGYTQFSPFLMDKCVTKSSQLLADINPKFETVILVSDGLCGSSCAIVVAYLQQHGSPAILLSPYLGSDIPPNLYSFAGGQVVNSNNIKDVAKKSSCFDMIPDVLERAQITITYRAIFNMLEKKTPLEYKTLPGNDAFEPASKYGSSFASRWNDFFPMGMDVFKNPTSFITDLPDEIFNCILTMSSFFC